MAKPNTRNEKVTLAAHGKDKPYKLRVNRDFLDENERPEIFRAVPAELWNDVHKISSSFPREKNKYGEPEEIFF